MSNEPEQIKKIIISGPDITLEYKDNLIKFFEFIYLYKIHIN